MYFEEELNFIINEEIKDIAVQGVSFIPEYFYHVSASSTGKYHPAYTVGEEGLYRHVQAAVRIAKMLFNIHDFTPDEQDVIIASLILHDGWKQGLDGAKERTLHAHPLIAVDVLKHRVECNTETQEEFLDQVCWNISSHMGQWNTNKWDGTVLPVPESKMQKYVHMCDYIASRKPIEFNFTV
jgi:hypothetical protein